MMVSRVNRTLSCLASQKRTKGLRCQAHRRQLLRRIRSCRKLIWSAGIDDLMSGDGNESSGAVIGRVNKRHACQPFSKIIARLGSIPAVSFIGTWLFGAMLFPSAFWATSLCGYFSLNLPLRAFSPTSRSFKLDTQLSLQTRLFRPWTRVAYFTCWS